MNKKLFIAINILLLIAEVFLYNIDDVFKHLFFDTGKLQGGYYLFSILITNFFIYTILLLRNNRLFLIFMLFILIPFGIDLGYYFTTDNFFGFNDLNLVLINLDYIFDSLNTFGKIIPKIIFLLLLILFFFYFIRKNFVENYISVKFVVLILLLNFITSFFMVQRTANSTFVPISYIKIYNNIVYYVNNRLYYGIRKELRSFPSNKFLYKDIIFILDESIEGEYLSINGYDIDTTPYLKSIENDILTNFGLAISGANCSASSNILLMSLSTPNQVPDKQGFHILKQPNIFEYMKNAGYETAYISGQSYKNKLQNYMTKYDLKYIDYFFQPQEIYTKDSLPLIPEKNIINNLKKFLNSKGKHFVFIVKKGAHFPYQRSYPNKYKRYKPVLKVDEHIDFNKREKMLNTYYNSIYYNVDIFFKYLLKDLPLKDTIIVYTSDHGQSILEEGILNTHCSANNPPFTQGTVPLFIIHNKSDTQFNKLNKNIYSHFNIMPTILYYAGYDKPFIKGMSLFDINKSNHINYFFSGDIFGRTNLSKNIIKLDK